jgi:hypothetical protein
MVSGSLCCYSIMYTLKRTFLTVIQWNVITSVFSFLNKIVYIHLTAAFITDIRWGVIDCICHQTTGRNTPSLQTVQHQDEFSLLSLCILKTKLWFIYYPSIVRWWEEAPWVMVIINLEAFPFLPSTMLLSVPLWPIATRPSVLVTNKLTIWSLPAFVWTEWLED